MSRNSACFLAPVIAAVAIGSPFFFGVFDPPKPQEPEATLADPSLPKFDATTTTRAVLITRDVTPLYSCKEGGGMINLDFVPVINRGTKGEIEVCEQDVCRVKPEWTSSWGGIGYVFAIPMTALTPLTSETANLVKKKAHVMTCADDDEACKWQRARNDLYNQMHTFEHITEKSAFAVVANDQPFVRNIREAGRVPTDYTPMVPKGTIVAIIKYSPEVVRVKGKNNKFYWDIPWRELKHIEPPAEFETKPKVPANKKKDGNKVSRSYNLAPYGYKAG